MANLTIFQFFHWYYPFEDPLWKKVAAESRRLAALGITHFWLPPATKGADGIYSRGYDPYDLYDLGEFNQKNTVCTKYGTMNEFLAAIRKAHQHKICILADTVLNHKAGADELEKFNVVKVDDNNRNHAVSEPFEIQGWTKFTFPGRGQKYSNYIWDFHSFSGIDWAEDKKEEGVFSIVNEYGEGWEDMLEDEKGNYDYLMHADVEFRNPAVRDEVKHWGEWFLQTTNVDGFRMDALKHINPAFIREWIEHMKAFSQKPLFFLGEYWNIHSVMAMKKYIDATGGQVQLFDAPLVNNFHLASQSGRDFDLRHILNNTLLQTDPLLAISLVHSHDLQPLQALDTPIADWFKVLAYALILLRQQGIPCVFYPDVYGCSYKDKGHDGNDYDIVMNPVDGIEMMLRLRRLMAHGEQRDFFDHNNCIGWIREGIREFMYSGCAVLLSNGDDGFKRMEAGKRHAGKKFVDAMGKRQEQVVIGKDGWGEFHCNGGSVSVWVREEAMTRLKEA